jgi:hypothetical protein
MRIIKFDDGVKIRECDDGTIRFYKHGKRHRDNDLPAIIKKSGYMAWWQNAKCHRVGGPAIIYASGRAVWLQYGRFHREDGPAIDRSWAQFWYLHGKLHREDGPAVTYNNDFRPKEWWVDGKKVPCDSQEKFERLMKLKGFW